MIDFFWVPTANGQRVAILLEETGETYTLRPVDMMQGQHLTPEYLAVNPIGKVPTIIDHVTGVTVYGTLAIALYLADKHGVLLGDSLAERAAVYHWAGVIASDLGPAFTGQYIFNVVAPEKLAFPIRYFDEQIARLLKVLDGQLARQPFLAGARYTLADALGYPAAVSSAARLPNGLQGYDHLQRWASEVGQRPAVRRAMDLRSAVTLPA
jgi:GST-like protein